MRRVPCFPATSFLVCLLAALSNAAAGIITFGSGANQFQMDFVEIGSPGNAADTSGSPNPAGSVDYKYFIGRYEVSRDMVSKANNAGSLGIDMHPMTFVAGGPRALMPATGISWYEAATFVNWLNVEKGFAPAYKFVGGVFQLWQPGDSGYDPTNPFRNSNANFVLPDADEWYKAAYYDPVTDTYYDYPTGSNSVPSQTTGGTTPGTAVYGNLFRQGPADVNNAGGLSPFGLMGLGGNALEWNETQTTLTNNSATANRIVRGGRWDSGSGPLAAFVRESVNPSSEFPTSGLRVVSLSMGSDAAIPEPNSVVIWSFVACAAALGLCKRRWLSRLASSK